MWMCGNMVDNDENHRWKMKNLDELWIFASCVERNHLRPHSDLFHNLYFHLFYNPRERADSNSALEKHKKKQSLLSSSSHLLRKSMSFQSLFVLLLCFQFVTLVLLRICKEVYATRLLLSLCLLLRFINTNRDYEQSCAVAIVVLFFDCWQLCTNARSEWKSLHKAAKLLALFFLVCEFFMFVIFLCPKSSSTYN